MAKTSFSLLNVVKVLLIQVCVIKKSLASENDLMIFILGGPERKVEVFSQSTEPNLEKYADPGSSNWDTEDIKRVYDVDYKLIFKIVKKVYSKRTKNSLTKTRIRHIPLTGDTKFSEVVELITSCNASYKVMLCGGVPMEKAADWCELIKSLSLVQNIPSIIWTCSERSQLPSKKVINKTFLSLLPGIDVTVKSIMSVLHHFWWRKVSIVRPSSPEYLFQVCDHLEKSLLVSSFFSLQEVMDLKDNSRTNLKEIGKQFWKKVFLSESSAVVMCLPYRLRINHKKHPTLITDFLKAAYAIDISQMEKVAMLLVDEYGVYEDQFPKVENYFNPFDQNDSREKERVLDEANLRRVIIDQNINSSPQTVHENTLLSRIAPIHINNKTLQKNRTQYERNTFENVLIISPLLEQRFSKTYKGLIMKYKNQASVSYTVYLMDAMLLAIDIVSKLLDRNRSKPQVDSRIFTSIALTETFQGFTGYLTFSNQTSSRQINFSIWDIVAKGDSQTVRKVIWLNTSDFNKYYKINPVKKITWLSDVQPQSDQCLHELKFKCPRNWTEIEYTLFGLLVIMIVSACFIFYYRKRQEWQALFKGPNKLFLTESDLSVSNGTSRIPYNEAVSSNEQQSSNKRVSWVALRVEQGSPPIFFKGEQVYPKNLCQRSVEMNGTYKKTLLQLQSLHHDNLCRFFGLLSTKMFHILVMEYGNRGSLRDVILHSSSLLNASIKMSFIKDLVKGMSYLHSSILSCHGRLKSQNCIIDAKFTLKISDYGVNKFLEIKKQNSCISSNPEDLLWTAPELLKSSSLIFLGSRKGDSYSFAIICQEVILCSEPYSMFNLLPEELIEKLKNPNPLLRPQIDSSDLGIEIVQIMKQCWQEEPELRLTFSAVNEELQNIKHDSNGNVVETIMKQLEDCSGKLQELVNERTEELLDEKKKTEQLLMKMLPPSIARMLMANQKIYPEMFEKTTIYFSDICGFTTIAHSSTPLQVVDFLNDLYTCFDEIIDRYEVYKVETIGDAYMVSSGIPKVIGDRHAEEAAKMALDIMSATTTFKVRHLPNIKLRIRIGMHSGSAVAGVVGFTAPRYCLFGDTINTASRLETTGIPSRIHISLDTKECLVKSSEKFHLEERGKISLKGRGEMVTFWLLGMDGFNKPLPDPGSLNEPSHGISQDKVKQAAAKNSSGNNSKPVITSKKNVKSFNTVNSPVPIRSGSSYLVSTPLVFLSSGSENIPQSRCQELPQTKVSSSSKKSIKWKKANLFPSSSVHPEK